MLSKIVGFCVCANRMQIICFGFLCSDETVGREMLIYLAQYLLDNYQILPEITNLVNTVDIWLVPSMNPDGYNRSQVRITFAVCPRY